MVVALICGGGNGAHVMSATAATQPNMEARVLTLYADEAERWSAAMTAAGGLTIVDTTGPTEKNIVAKPFKVSKKAEEVVPGVDVILFAVPAFAHEQYLNALKPHIKPGAILVGLPGQAGFEFAVRGIWGDVARQCTIMNFITLPWNCRLVDFGKKVSVMSVKDAIPGAIQLSTPAPANDPIAVAQSVLGAKPILQAHGHFLGISLSPSNPILHPTIMYGAWSSWDGTPLDKKPLFYNDLSEESAVLLSGCSDEVCNVAKELMKQRPQADLTNVKHAVQYFKDLFGDEIADKSSLYSIIRTCSGFKVDLSTVKHAVEYYKELYGDDIQDKSNLCSILRTCAAFKGLTHPMTETKDGKFVPDFKFRYLWEDVPFGMAVIKGIASIAGVPTPNIDKVLTWAQGIMGKEYVVNGAFTGKDVGSTRSPQKYGLTTVDQVLGLQ